MVRALLAGTKTQTRRTRGLDFYNEQPERWSVKPIYLRKDALWEFAPMSGSLNGGVVKCPYGAAGDRLWLRERARRIGAVVDRGRITSIDLQYEADGATRIAVPFPDRIKPVRHGHCLSMGCYREASRISLEITDVRVQRLQEISEEDAIAEGVEADEPPSQVRAADNFSLLWEKINGAGSWGANPWVWALTFKRAAE